MAGRVDVTSTANKSGAWILTVGDELLRGEIVDSNKSFFSERLLRLDVECTRHITVADDADAISEVLREAASRARVVVISGGLGPTRDDITTRVAAKTFGRTLVRDEEVLEGIRAFFLRFGREMAANNAKQADFPEAAEILPNPLGTAPGFVIEVEGTWLFFTPGVPRELYRMVDEEILPRLQSRFSRTAVVRAALLRTFGMGESTLDRELSDLAQDDSSITLGFRTQFPDNLVRVVVRAENEDDAKEKLQRVVGQIHERLGPMVLSEDERPMEAVVGELLAEQNLTVALAESCTGGLLSHRLTEVPGSSRYLIQSIVAYADEAKIRELGVDPALLKAEGAVSAPVALAMAEGVRQRSGADFGISTTGIAGPGGGTDEKPVGTVFVALSTATKSDVRKYELRFDRVRNKELTTQLALDFIRRTILGMELPSEDLLRPTGKRGGAH